MDLDSLVFPDAVTRLVYDLGMSNYHYRHPNENHLTKFMKTFVFESIPRSKQDPIPKEKVDDFLNQLHEGVVFDKKQVIQLLRNAGGFYQLLSTNKKSAGCQSPSTFGFFEIDAGKIH